VKKQVQTDAAPDPIGPDSQGIRDGRTVHVSGQGPADPDTREVVAEGSRDQTAQALDNVAAVLDAAGASLDDAVRATVYLADMDDYDAMNDVYAERVPEPYPSRAAVEVARLPGPFRVEISAVARLSDPEE
jgi:2-iminobutanoate/2-iminopropanoate deaminase